MTDIPRLVNRFDPIVHRPSDAIDFSNPQIDIVELEKTLTEALRHYGGFGLSANMIGIPYAAIAIAVGDRIECAFNAKIVAESPDMVYIEEGNILYPGLVVKIKRPAEVRVRFTTATGETNTAKFSGLTSRLVQHYIDMQNGVPFTKRATKFHLDQARRRL